MSRHSTSSPLSALRAVIQTCAALSVLSVNPVAGAPPIDRLTEITAFFEGSNVTLLSAVIAARGECPAGTPFRAGISRRHPEHAIEVLFLAANRKRVVRVEIDAICGDVLAAEDEPAVPKEIADLLVFARDRPDRLEVALKCASKNKQRTVIGAELQQRNNAPPIAQITVLRPTGFSDLLIESTDDESIELVHSKK